MALSTSSIITLGSIFLVVCVFGIAKKAISAAMLTVAACLVAVYVIQSTSDVVLIDFSNLGDFCIHWALRLFQWTQDTFWPKLTEVAREIEKAI